MIAMGFLEAARSLSIGHVLTGGTTPPVAVPVGCIYSVRVAEQGRREVGGGSRRDRGMIDGTRRDKEAPWLRSRKARCTVSRGDGLQTDPLLLLRIL
jgi:hypothetical protein